jgi:alkyl hydroperoxide reductase subunit F
MMNLQRAEKLVPASSSRSLRQRRHAEAKFRHPATGARWRELGVPGESEYRNHGVAYCPHCDGPLFKGKRVAVIGGGNSGVEAAIDLAGIVKHVTLIEFAPQLRADAVLVNKLRSLPNVRIHARRRPGDHRRRQNVTACATSIAPAADHTMSNWKACSCRSAWCPTPTG